LLEQIGSGRILVEDASLVSLNPEADQIARDVEALRQPMERLAGEKLLSNLALELDAVGTMPGHGLPSFESPAYGQILTFDLSGPRGPLQSSDEREVKAGGGLVAFRNRAWP
jgi:hypothetical protein